MTAVMDRLGMTRLGVAALRSDADEVKRLLTTDNVFERDVYGNTAAHYAIARFMTTEDMPSREITEFLDMGLQGHLPRQQRVDAHDGMIPVLRGSALRKEYSFL
eukprot:2001202-Prymnesium_polylepis.1